MRVLLAPLGFAVAVVVLWSAGHGDLAAPPLDDPMQWVDDVGPITAGMGLVRLAALAAAVWMCIVSLVSAMARLFGATHIADAADQVMPPALRRALTGLAGAGAAGAALVGATNGSTAGLAATAPAAEQMVRLPAEVPGTDPSTAGPASAGAPMSTATMVVLPDTPAASSSAEWTVEPGDSFWSIAEDVVADALGRPPSDAEVDGYWRRLVDANRDRLVSLDPDLVLPGQVFTLPAV